MAMLRPILLGILLPAVVAGLALLVAWRPWRRGGGAGGGGAGHAEAAAGAWGGALGFGCGYVAGQLAGVGLPAFPPRESMDWFPWIAFAAALLGLLEASGRGPAWLRWGLRAALSVGAIRLVLAPEIAYRAWGVWESSAWVAGLAVAGLLVWSGLEAAARRAPAAALAPAWVVAGTAVALVLAQSGNAKLGQAAGSLTSAVGAAMVLSWLAPAASFSRGGVPVLAALFPALLVVGCTNNYGEAPTASFLLAAAALPAPLAGILLLRSTPGRPSWKHALLNAAVTLVPAGIGVGLALRAAGAE
ncbi:MAG: hypothetical protein HYZ53_19020 [Planctomycetes bacterium]|nr:hypothetical protein [Planctomycetota bacterium]